MPESITYSNLNSLRYLVPVPLGCLLAWVPGKLNALVSCDLQFVETIYSRFEDPFAKMLAFFRSILDWIKSLFWKEEMELTLVGLQYSGKTTFVNVIAVRFRSFVLYQLSKCRNNLNLPYMLYKCFGSKLSKPINSGNSVSDALFNYFFVDFSFLFVWNNAVYIITVNNDCRSLTDDQGAL